MNHHGFQYKIGENVDCEEFYGQGTCHRGGLYFTYSDKFHKFLNYGNGFHLVAIPSDAKVYTEAKKKGKASKIIISDRYLFDENNGVTIITNEIRSVLEKNMNIEEFNQYVKTNDKNQGSVKELAKFLLQQQYTKAEEYVEKWNIIFDREVVGKLIYYPHAMIFLCNYLNEELANIMFTPDNLRKVKKNKSLTTKLGLKYEWFYSTLSKKEKNAVKFAQKFE